MEISTYMLLNVVSKKKEMEPIEFLDHGCLLNLQGLYLQIFVIGSQS